jgi:site-specific DNA-methyltransferase (adenine-specific)
VSATCFGPRGGAPVPAQCYNALPFLSVITSHVLIEAAVLDIHFGDNLDIISAFPDRSFDLIYIDPPFNTGKAQSRTQIKTIRDESGDRTGFQGKRYRTVKLGTKAYDDIFSDYLGFLEPRLVEAHRLLTSDGSFFLHLDYREVHYAKVLLDQIFGRECFINEIIWAYDYGARSTKKWSAKHDNILWYAKNPEKYTFDLDAVDRIPYMAPGLVGPEKAARGKTPTDTWWHTIVSPNGKEKTGYPTQKPLGVIERIVKVHSKVGDRLLDFFAGSGTFGEAAVRNGRTAVLVDNNPEAIEVMVKRLAFASPSVHGFDVGGMAGNSGPVEDLSDQPSLFTV